MKYDKNIDFVAQHYRENSFSVDKAWQRTGIAVHSRRKWKTAAAVAILTAVSASAGIYLYMNSSTPAQQETPASIPANELSAKISIIDFENTPLPLIIDEIERVYKVKIEGISIADNDKKITIHYEGNLDSLLKAINEIADTNLRVAEQ